MRIFVPRTLWYETDQGDDLGSGHLFEHPAGATIQVSQFPCVLHTSYIGIDEKGRSKQIATASASWPHDLVLAMATVPWWKFWLTRYPLDDAILIVASTCERCMNVLAYRYGLPWGYKEGSKEWNQCGTSCQFCVGHIE